jgi:hypothetical protein
VIEIDGEVEPFSISTIHPQVMPTAALQKHEALTGAMIRLGARNKIGSKR